MNTQYLKCGVFSLFFIYVRNQKVVHMARISLLIPIITVFMYSLKYKKNYVTDTYSKISLISLEKVELTELSAE